ncbi:hypothetical protein ABLN97_15825 [Mycobacterium tuberculosis]
MLAEMMSYSRVLAPDQQPSGVIATKTRRQGSTDLDRPAVTATRATAASNGPDKRQLDGAQRRARQALSARQEVGLQHLAKHEGEADE